MLGGCTTNKAEVHCTGVLRLGISLVILIHDFYSFHFGSHAMRSPLGGGLTFSLLCLQYFLRFTSCLAVFPSLSSSHQHQHQQLGCSLEATTLLGQTSCRQPAQASPIRCDRNRRKKPELCVGRISDRSPNYSRHGTVLKIS